MASFKKDSKVQILSPKDFSKGKLTHKELKNGRTTVVFAADWCSHCQALKPMIAEISKMSCCISNTAAVDCDKDKELVAQLNKDLKGTGFEVSGFPTIVQFVDGVYNRSYKEERTPKALLAFFLGK